MRIIWIKILALCCLYSTLDAQTVINGQVFTPGIAIVDAPQPNTPLGGDTLHVALDVTSNGQLQLPPYPADPISAIYNITIFLSSYATGKNFTVSNGTATANDASLGEIMLQEPGSTVKHVNWVWPDCLVGDGAPKDSDPARGSYNISIRQNFRLNGADQYTIFDLPIQVTNSIPETFIRPSCDSLNNALLSEAELVESASNFTQILGTVIQTGSGSDNDEDLGGSRPEAVAADGLGGAGVVDYRAGVHWVWIGALIYSAVL
ncbi:hypothetical protein PVAG01_09423 [Phlyctema vagabunda]|uniref:Uncharacterized protein n=1 Tax=Phlyctema vagabunda TaxID=108571 RepID=A0ABR4P7B2_9HELO